jgi:hypothetical protein
MRKQASESPEVTVGLGGTQPRSAIGPDLRSGQAAGWAPARGVGGPSPPRGLGLAERVSSTTREGQGRSAYAGRVSGHLALAWVR